MNTIITSTAVHYFDQDRQRFLERLRAFLAEPIPSGQKREEVAATISAIQQMAALTT